MTTHPVTRSALFLIGGLLLVVGIGLLVAGNPDESEEILFATGFTCLGALNVAAAFITRWRMGVVAIVADVLLIAFIVDAVSENSIG